jgi:superkiller protein 3
MSKSRRSEGQSKDPTVGPVSEGKLKRLGRRVWLLAAMLVAVFAVVGFYVGRGNSPVSSEIPSVNLEGADPQIVELVEIARAAVEKSPHSAAAWGQFAMVLHANGFSEAAHVCYAAATRLEPMNPAWPYLQGYLHHRESGGPETALPFFNQAASLGPPNSMARLRLADMLLELGHVDEAAQEYRKLLSVDNNDALGQMGLAKVAVARKQYRDTLPYLESISESPFVQHQACAMRSVVLDRLGDRVGADRERRRLAELPEDRLRPDDPAIFVLQMEVGVGTYLRKADELWQQQRAEEMVATLEEAVHRYPNSVEVWAALGNAWGAMGDLGRAERALRRGTELAPKDSARWLSLGNLQIRQQRFPEARESIEHAIELNPRDGQAYFSLGECRQKLNDPAGAAAAYRETLRYAPDHPQARQRLESLGERANVPIPP